MNDELRVNLQYTIALKELPFEVGRLINKAAQEIENCHKEMSPKLVEGDDESKLSLKTIDTISQTKAHLAAITHILEDLENIINGYISYRSQPRDTESTNNAMAAAQAPPSSEGATEVLRAPMEELVEKLELFKQQQVTQLNEKPHTTKRKEV